MRSASLLFVVSATLISGGLNAVDLRYPDGNPCMEVMMDAEFTITNGNEEKKFTLDGANVTSGDCINTPRTLKANLPDENSVTFIFSQTSASDVTMDFTFTYDPSSFFNGSEPAIISLPDDGSLGLGNANQAFECNSEIKRNFPPVGSSVSMTMSITNAKIQAFNMNGSFSSDVFVCAQDQANETTTVSTAETTVTTAAVSTANSSDTTTAATPTNSTETTSANTSPASNSSTSQQTTEPPVTTSEATTTVGPTIPPPPISTFKVSVNDTVCLIMSGAFQLQVKYARTNMSDGTAFMNIPPNADTSGSCGTDKSSLTVSFTENNASRTVTFNFDIYNGSARLASWDVALELDTATFPDHADETLSVNITQNTALAKVDFYYMCDAKLSLTDEAAVATMMVTQLKVQAFNLVNGYFSQNGYDCKEDVPFVPTAVTKDTFSVSEGNVTCIVFQAEMKMDITYKKDNKDETRTIYVPPSSNITQFGSCNLADNIIATTQELKLTFFDNWEMTFTFAKDVETVKLAAAGDFSYHLDEIELKYTLNSNLFPDADSVGQTFTVKQNFTDQLVGSNQGSYMCNADTTLDMGDDVTLTTTNLQYQAFKDTEGTDFGRRLNAVDLRYPDDNPCMEVMMDAEFTITNGNEEKKFTLDGANVTSGNCINTLHTLKANLPDENSVTFKFLQTSASDVTMDLMLTYDPSSFFNDSEPATASLSDDGNLGLGNVNQTFECNSEVKRSFPQNGLSISMTMSITNAKIQAFNMNGSFSSDVFVCAQDQANETTTVSTAETTVTTAAVSTANSSDTTTAATPTNSTETTSANTSPASNSSTSQQTTEPPVTTSEATTTVGPTIPPPPISTFKVSVNDTACLIMSGAFQLQVKYARTNMSDGTAFMNIPPNAVTSGSCGTDKSSLTVSFTESNATRTVTFNFDIDNGSARLASWDVALELDTATFPDHADETLSVNITQNTALAKVDFYYMCDAKLSLTDEAAVATMMVTRLKVQAFNLVNGDFSQNGYDCNADVPFIPTAVTKDTFSVSEGNVTCIVFQAEMKMDITYKKDNKDETKTIYVPPTSNITQSGSCNLADNITATTQELKLTFFDGWVMTFTFAKDVETANLAAAGDFSYHLDEIELKYTLNSNLFPDADSVGQTFTVKQNFTDQLVGSNQGSYMCNADTTLDMGDDVTLTTTNLQYQAFKDTEGTDFGTATDCKVNEEQNSIVPIAVGAALVGLVVIVLIAYLIDRRRSRTGYEQVNEDQRPISNMPVQP